MQNDFNEISKIGLVVIMALITKFIQNAQLKAKNDKEVLEWIEYDKFENIEYLAKGGVGTTYKAIWKGGNIVGWNYENIQWDRWGERHVALKCLHNSQNITVEFLKEVRNFLQFSVLTFYSKLTTIIINFLQIESHLLTNNSNY